MVDLLFDVKIPATNRFSKCQTCERLKKMIHSGNIEVGHDLSQEDLQKLGNDKVRFMNTLCVLYISAMLLIYIFFPVEFRKKPKHTQNNCS